MCLACSSKINPADLDAFGERFIGMLNEAATVIMISVGHRTGLFEVMKGRAPSTSEEIANASGLNERYVREWLGAMTAAHIVECTPTGTRFALPAAHAAMLTQGDEAESIAHLSQFITQSANVEDKVLECFERGGGVPYSAYPRFHEVMEIDSNQSVVNALLDRLLPLVPGLIQRLEEGIRVLDVGCGRGSAMTLLASRFPQSQFHGLDLSEEAVAYGRDRGRNLGLTNLHLQAQDLTDFDETASPSAFDLVTAFDAIHDQARPDRLLKGVRKTLRNDGIFFVQDIAGSSNVYNNREHPLGPLFYMISCMHCMTVSLAQGGMGLGAMWGEELATRMFLEAGFSKVERRTLEHDIQNYYYLVWP